MGEFAKRAASALKWEEDLNEQRGRLGKFIPPSKDEAAQKALEDIAWAANTAFGLGYSFRKRQREREGVESLLPQVDESLGVPGREVMISLPDAAKAAATLMKEAQEAVTVTLRSSKPDSSYPSRQLKKGIGVEKEHANDKTARKIISKHHLDERSRYYDELEDMEAKPKSAGILGALAEPLGEAVEDLKLRALENLDRRRSRLTRVTSDPATLPWYYPGMISFAPKNFMEGFRTAESEADTARLTEVTGRMDKAKEEFEKALQDEYRAAKGGAKESSCGEFVSGLAKAHVKAAEGELNQILGGYLTIAALLGQLSHHSAYDWVAKRDPARLKLDAFREAIKQRMRAQTAPVQVEPPALDTSGSETL